MAAGHALSAYEADPSRRVAICDRAGNVRWHEVWDGNPIIARPADVVVGEPVQRIRNGVGCRPYIKSLSVDSGLTCTDWKASEHLGRIYLTEDELAVGRELRAQIGPYVLVEPCLKALSNQNKSWGVDRYAAVVGACSEFQFVQMLHEQSTPIAGAHTLTVDSFRKACGVLASADAYLGPEGGLHHAAAALGVRAVVIFGGFISALVTGYPTHVNIADDGPGSPCGKWRPCAHCRIAMARISVRRVATALRSIMARVNQPEASCAA